MSNTKLSVRSEKSPTGLRAKAALVLLVAVVMLVMSLPAVGASAQPALTCPSHRPQGVPPNPWPAAHRELAPKGARAISLCRYAGANAHPRLGLIATDLIDGRRTINMLTREFDSLIPFAPATKGPHNPFPPVVIVCPKDSGAEVLATLLYPRHQRVTIQVDLQGCNPVSNGDLTRTAANLGGKNPAGPRLLAELRRLTTPKRQPDFAG